MPAGAQPAWAEIIGAIDHPDHVRWHPDPATMMGFVAPPSCDAITVVAYGWGRRVDDEELRSMGAGIGPEVPPGHALLAPGERRRFRVVCLMTRAGDMAGYLRAGPTILVDEPPTIGRVPDFLRRCFRLPTPPPTESTDGLFARIWLANVAGAGERSERPFGWTDAIRLHPAVQVAEEVGITIPDKQFSMALRVAAEVWDWASIARQAHAPGWLASFLPPDAAGWMDEGILSRWLLGGLAPVEVLLDQAIRHLTVPATKKLLTTLRKVGVPIPRHPKTDGAPYT